MWARPSYRVGRRDGGGVAGDHGPPGPPRGAPDGTARVRTTGQNRFRSTGQGPRDPDPARAVDPPATGRSSRDHPEGHRERGHRPGPHHPRRPLVAPARHRSGRDRGVDRVLRRDARGAGRAARPLHHVAAAPARAGASRLGAVAVLHRLRQHHPDRPGAVVPGRRGDRAALPGVDPVERGGDGAPRAAPGRRGRRAHLDLRVGGVAVRGRLQLVLPRQGPPRRRRPRLHPGPRLPRHLRPRLPRGPPGRPAPRRLPPGALARRAGRRPAVVPAPAADAGVLGAPDGVDGPRPDQRDLPGALRPLPAQPRDEGHQPAAHLGVPRRRRDGRAGVARGDPRRGGRGPRQPDLRHQLQPAAPRRAGARQRQGHPGAGVVLPRRGLERRQGHLGP